jgi:hypothetical protein
MLRKSKVFVPSSPFIIYLRGSLSFSLSKTFGITSLIIGRQTKPYRSPQVAWVEDIVKTAKQLDIKVFLKNNLRGFLPDYDLFYVGSGEARHLRQEVP